MIGALLIVIGVLTPYKTYQIQSSRETDSSLKFDEFDIFDRARDRGSGSKCHRHYPQAISHHCRICASSEMRYWSNSGSVADKIFIIEQHPHHLGDSCVSYIISPDSINHARRCNHRRRTTDTHRNGKLCTVAKTNARGCG
jgi:hypothetical protein